MKKFWQKIHSAAAILPKLIIFLRQHILVLASAVLLVLLVAGGYGGWRYYQYRQSPEYACQALKEALHPAKAGALAELIDFSYLSEDIAKAIAAQYPFLEKGPQQKKNLSTRIQMALLQMTRTPPEPAKEEDPALRLKTPLYALPQDLLTQVAQSLTFVSANTTMAQLTAKVRHPLLDENFSLSLRMKKTATGWKLQALNNSNDLAQQYRAAQMRRMQAKRQIPVDKNVQVSQRMTESFPILSCQASAGLISDKRTLLVVVSVQAKNKGTVTINNMNLSMKLETSDGKELLHRYLNTVDPTEPGTTLEHRWTIELDGQQKEGSAILAAQPLVCKAQWQTLGLANGEVLHIAEIPELQEEFR